ncbi:hypothetical protein [Chromobacterium sp. Beijing]|uniref:hypothetical protein n=1 Tax=Chromobacterium sp. Beijing TaxID=2735795 RepID=UPI001F3A896C|nr:hypothetical protein [Chromobacterium sp. Beijing]UJB32285.1 hypothetical protein HQN78_15205 [Chromobacterium sp. Beijing]
MKARSLPPRRQRGVAAVLMVLLTGMALTALALGGMHHLRGQQELTRSLRGNSEAQWRAWTGAELARQYLSALTPAQIKALELDGAALNLERASLPPESQALADALQIKLLPAPRAAGAVIEDDKVAAWITARSGDATVTLEVVYQLNGAPTPPAANAAAQIRGGLSTSGNIVVTGAKDALLQVEGAVDTSGSLSGVSAIQATGDILFQGNPARGDGQAPLSLWSNGDIRVNSGQFLTLKARGNIVMGSGSDVETAAANGSVGSSGERVGRLSAIGDVTLAGNVAVSAQLLSQGDVRTSSSNRLNALRAQGLLDSRGNANIDDGLIGGAFTHNGAQIFDAAGQARQPPPNTVRVRHQTGLKVPLEPVPEFRLGATRVNANDYRDAANLIVYWDAADRSADALQRIRVRLQHVAGVPDGAVYRLGRQRADDWQRNDLCPALQADGRRCAPVAGQPALRLCESDAESCLSGSTAQQWLLRLKPPQGMLPGVALFEGNLSLYGRLDNAILATGHIETSSNVELWSLRQAGAARVCRSPDFPDVYPLNHCAADRNSLRESPLLGIALLAGGYDAAQAFGGGKIRLGASNRIHGAVLAGDTLDTAGSTHIFGPVSAGLQSRPPGAPPPSRPLNSLGAETVIDISGQNGLPGEGGGGTPNPQTGAARVLWARYR